MAFTLSEIANVSGYALASAIASASTVFALTTVVSASAPLSITLTVLGSVGGLIYTAHGKIQEIKKDYQKTKIKEDQYAMQARLKTQLAELKPRIEKLLTKEEKKEEKKIRTTEKKVMKAEKKTADPGILNVSSVLQAKKEQAAADRKKAREYRENKLKRLKGALVQLNQDILPEAQNNIPPLAEKPPAKLEDKDAKSVCEKVVHISKGAVKGGLGGGTTTYAAIQTGAAMASRIAPSFFSAPMMAPMVTFAILGAGVNAVLATRTWADELKDQEDYNNSVTTRKHLEEEYDSIFKLFEEVNVNPTNKKIKPGSPTSSLTSDEAEVSNIMINMDPSDSSTSVQKVGSPVAVRLNILPMSSPSSSHPPIFHKSSPESKTKGSSTVAVSPNILPMSSPPSSQPPVFHKPSSESKKKGSSAVAVSPNILSGSSPSRSRYKSSPKIERRVSSPAEVSLDILPVSPPSKREAPIFYQPSSTSRNSTRALPPRTQTLER